MLIVHDTLRMAPRPKLDVPRVMPSNFVSAGLAAIVDSYQVPSAVASPWVEWTEVDQSPVPHPCLTRKSMEPLSVLMIQMIQMTPNSLSISTTMYAASAIDAIVPSNWCAVAIVAMTATSLVCVLQPRPLLVWKLPASIPYAFPASACLVYLFAKAVPIAVAIVAMTATSLGPPRPRGNAPVEPWTVPAKNVIAVVEPVEVPVPPSLQVHLPTR